MLNPFFLQGSSGEQGLLQDLINEQLRMYGVEVYYMPRKYMTKNTVIEEVIESKFENAYPIEAYVSSYDGYGGQGTILSKFGIQDLDDLTLVISKERFENYITPLIKNISNIELSTRPKEGDLIFFPLGNKIFEIKYVEHESPFYQLQKNYVYELRCELFRYGDEVIDTDIDTIDDVIEDYGNVQTLNVLGIGSTATAIAGIIDSGVSYITITNRGRNYTSAPRVAISSSPEVGGTAIGIATLISGIVDQCDTLGTGYRVQGVELRNSGYGYTQAPMVAFIGGGGEGVEAYASISDGIVGVITVTSGGSGYYSEPSVTFVGSASTAATARAIVRNGSITEIRITNAGVGYGSTPTITISAPNLIGTGSFIYNETVTGLANSVRARVNSWNSSTNVLELKNIQGDFVGGEIIVGDTSQAMYQVSSINTTNDDSYSQNDEIQTESDLILDFTESNPFGTP